MTQTGLQIEAEMIGFHRLVERGVSPRIGIAL
jgi:hypothetical protein